MIRSEASVAKFSDDLHIWRPMSSGGFGVDAESALTRIDAMKRLLTGSAMEISETEDQLVYTNSIEGKLLEKRSSLKRIAASVGMYLDPDWRTRLFAKIDSLLDPVEWDEDFALPSEQSFSTFLRMVIYLHPTKRPGLGLSAKGYFLASWAKNQDRIVVECLSNDDVRWVLSHNLKGFLESGAGKTKIYRLSDVIHPYEPDELFWDDHKILV